MSARPSRSKPKSKPVTPTATTSATTTTTTEIEVEIPDFPPSERELQDLLSALIEENQKLSAVMKECSLTLQQSTSTLQRSSKVAKTAILQRQDSI